MNAIRSHCTNRILFLVVGALLCARAAFAQEARLTGSFTSGGFRGPSEAETLWSVGAFAGGEKEWPDLILRGHFGFTQEYGTAMCGSMFTEPGYYPVDVVEFTPGDKSRQTYDIGGGLALKNASRWIPGADITFRGINYAKRKDLRHTTYRQEMALSPFVQYKADGWHADLRYTFGKTSEFIQAEQIGPARAESYYAFLDKGLFFGTYQAWDGSGVHLSEPGVDRFPVNELSHGVSLSAEGFGLEASAGFTYSMGEVGEKGYTWFRFPSREIDAMAAYTFMENDIRHRIRAQYSWKNRRLFESVIEKVNDGGVTTPSIIGANRVYLEKRMDLAFSYRIDWPDGRTLEAFMLIDDERRLSTLMFPFFDLDTANHFAFGVESTRPVGPFSIRGGFRVGALAFDHQDSVNTDNDNIGVSSTPFRLTDWFEKDAEWTDALRLGLSLALRYNFKAFYLEAGCDWTHAFGVQFLPGANRQTTQITIGYKW